METEDRPLRDIINSVMALVTAKKVQGQLSRDLEKLCAAAMTSHAYEQENPDPSNGVLQ